MKLKTVFGAAFFAFAGASIIYLVAEEINSRKPRSSVSTGISSPGAVAAAANPNAALTPAAYPTTAASPERKPAPDLIAVYWFYDNKH